MSQTTYKPDPNLAVPDQLHRSQQLQRGASAPTPASGGAEVTGLGSAIGYADAQSRAAESNAAEIASVLTALQEADVAGEAVEAVRQAREHLLGAAWEFARAKGALIRHQQTVGEAYAASPDAGSREFVTSEGEDPPMAAEAPALDQLKLAGRIPLGQDESLIGSAVSDTSDTDGSIVPLAVVRTPAGPRLRIATGVDPEDRGRWRAANLGGTANLDSASLADLRQALPRMVEVGVQADQRRRDLEAQAERLHQRRRELIRSQYPTLTRPQARELDQLDEQIESLDSRIGHLESRQQDRLSQLRPEARTELDRLTAQIEQVDRDRAAALAEWDRGDRRDNDAFGRYRELDHRILDLMDAQRAAVLGRSVAELHELDELNRRPGLLSPDQAARRNQLRRPQSGLGSHLGDSADFTFWDRDRRELESLTGERERVAHQRSELTRDAVPLSAASTAELDRVASEFEQTDRELLELTDGDVLAEGSFRGDWLDLGYRVTMTESGPRYTLQVDPAADQDNESNLTEPQLQQLASTFDELLN